MKRRGQAVKKARRYRARISSLRQQLEQYRAYVAELETALSVERELRRQVEAKNEIDHMTGVFNRQSFDKARWRLDQSDDVTIILFDGNRIGQVNKRHGHKRGDEEIRKIAGAIRQAVKESPHSTSHQIWRYGGDEFVVAVTGNYQTALGIMIRAKFLYPPQALEGHPDRPVIGLEAAIGATFDEADHELRGYKEIYTEDGESHYRDRIDSERTRSGTKGSG